MCNFRIHNETYSAIVEWLQHLEQYDDIYIRENITDYKTRYIQQKAASKNDPTPPGQEIVTAYMVISENNFSRPPESGKKNPEEPKFDKSEANLHALELQVFVDPVNTRANLEEELENLSDTLYDFVDIDDNLIDFLK
jgi:hypothetical protein